MDLNNKPKRLLAFSAAFFVIVLIAAWQKENGFKDIQKLSAAINELDGKISDLQAENDRQVNELHVLNASNSYVESIARESLGLVKPGEVVYEFVDAGKLGGSEKPDVQMKGSGEQ